MKIDISINGQRCEADVEPRLLLVHFIRDLAGLTGTHIGCETSICGACTAMMNGKAVKTCAGIEVTRIGSGFTWLAEDPAEPRGLAREAWLLSKEAAFSGRYDLLVLDELNCAVAEGYVEVEEVLEMLAERPSELSVIITGRDAKPELIAAADTATEMRSLKHAFDHGVPARKGIEY